MATERCSRTNRARTMDTDLIIELIELARSEGASGLRVESHGQVVDFRLVPTGVWTHEPSAPPSSPEPAAAEMSAAEATGELSPAYFTVRAPWVGIFHRRLDDGEVVARVGEAVSPETTLGAIESLKVMNEVQAEVEGTLREVLADEDDPVEYGQPLFLIEVVRDVEPGA